MKNIQPRPWKISECGKLLLDANGHAIEFNKSQFHRIIDCVNACARMDDPVVEVQRLKNKAAWGMDDPVVSEKVESLYTSSTEALSNAIAHAKECGFSFADCGTEYPIPSRPGTLNPQSWHELGILPPVGAECEIIIEGDSLDFVGELNGILCKIIAHDILPSGEHVAVFSYDTEQFGFQKKYHSLVAKCFLPAQTEKQKTIKAMLECFDGFFTNGDNAGDVCEKIYDQFIANKKEK